MFLHVIGAVLMIITTTAFLTTLPFYTPGMPEITPGLSWFIIVLLFTAITSLIYFIPSLNQLTMWKPAEFAESSRFVKIGYLAGSILLLVAVLVVTIISAINTPEIIKDPSLRRVLSEGLIWPITLGVVASVIFYTGWFGVFALLHKLGDLFNTPVLCKLGIPVLIYGLVFVLIKTSLITTHYAYLSQREIALLHYALIPLLVLPLPIAILGAVTWTLIYAEIASLEKKITSGAIQI